MTMSRRHCCLLLAALITSYCGFQLQATQAFSFSSSDGRQRQHGTETHLVTKDDARPYSDGSCFSAQDLVSFDRRSTLATLMGTCVTSLLPTSAIASDNDTDELSLARPLGTSSETSRPSAPIEYLIPAARVGLYIYQALAITEELSILQKSSSPESRDSGKKAENVARLDALLLSPPSFIKNSDPTVSRGDPYNSLPPVVGEMGAVIQKQKERKERSIDVGLAPSFFELGELVGERRQWNQLQKAERVREGASEIRRAFNIYTTNLHFNPNKYEWKGTKEERSRRIRDEKLPTATDVIRSDLDARDLYRNQVQTALEDARAEYLYQKKESGGDPERFDGTELLGLLKDAQVAADRWFNFIPDVDVKAALDAVRREQQLAAAT